MKLSALQTTKGQYCLLELEPTFLESWMPATWWSAQELVRVLSPESSGIVLSPVETYYGLEYKADTAGLVLSLEFPWEREMSSTALSGLPRLVENWSIEQVRHNYAVAKLRLAYHPQTDLALKKKRLVAELYDYSKHEGIDFLLELVPESGLETDTVDELIGLAESELIAINEFRALCDGLILRPPPTALAAATITAELDVPWLVSGRGVTYQNFKDALRLSLESGARGFVVGDSLWHDHQAEDQDHISEEKSHTLEEQPHVSENQFRQLATTVWRDRLIELSRISNELAQAPESGSGVSESILKSVPESGVNPK